MALASRRRGFNTLAWFGALGSSVLGGALDRRWSPNNIPPGIGTTFVRGYGLANTILGAVSAGSTLGNSRKPGNDRKSDDSLHLAGDVMVIGGGLAAAVGRTPTVVISGVAATALGWLLSLIGSTDLRRGLLAPNSGCQW